MAEQQPVPQRKLEDFAEIASDWFWETDQSHQFTYLSRRVERVLNLQTHQIIGRSRTAIGQAASDDPNWAAHIATLHAHEPFRNFEYALPHPTTGSTLWLRVSGRPFFDGAGYFVGYRGVGQDITSERMSLARLSEMNAALEERNRELNQTRKALERSAFHDSLTNLLNRRAFERDLEEALGVSGNKVILLHIDLDRFKWVNDTYGHPAGDTVLEQAAIRIRHIASGTGPAYRIGGDEFLVVLADNAEIDSARWIADTLVEELEAPITLMPQTVAIGASIGIAQGTGGDVTPRQLIANADIALYEAKRSGRGCVRELTSELLEKLAARRQLASELPAAIVNGEFIPYFQPQVHADTGAVIGAEALARWAHPTHGMLAPDAFMDIATELGLVAEIDRCIMQQSLDFSACVCAEGLQLASISINLSAGRLTDQRLFEDIDTLWRDRSCRLAIELLETICFEDLHQQSLMTANLNQLRSMGVKIETDDFGSGRASITSLLMVRPDRLKIDRHLVQAAVKDPVQRKVVAAILDMTRALGIGVIAEGVETANDIAIIRRLGCEQFQGYAFAPPLGEAAFRAYLRAGSMDPEMQTAGPESLPQRA